MLPGSRWERDFRKQQNKQGKVVADNNNHREISNISYMY